MNSPAERYNLANNHPESNAQAAPRALESFARSELRRQRARASDPGRFEIIEDSDRRSVRLAAEIADARPADRLTIGNSEDPVAQQHQYIVEAIERQALPRGHFYNACLQSMVADLRALSLADLPSISRDDDKRVSERARRVLRRAIRQLDLRTGDRNQVFDINDDRIQSIIQQGAAAAQRAHTQATHIRELTPAFDASWPDAPDTVRHELSKLVRNRRFDPDRIQSCLSITKTSETLANALVDRERERYGHDRGEPRKRHFFDDGLRKQWNEFRTVLKNTDTRIRTTVNGFGHNSNIDQRLLFLEVCNELHQQCLLRDRLCIGPIEFPKNMESYILRTVRNACIDWYRKEKNKLEDPTDVDKLERLFHAREASEPSSDSDHLDRVTLSAQRHALSVLPIFQAKASQELAHLFEELQRLDGADRTADLCNLMWKLASISIEIYGRWIRGDRVKRAVHLLLLGNTDKPRAQMKRFKLLISEAYGEIDDPWFQRYGYELPQDKSKKRGAFGSLEGSDYHNFNHYTVGRRTGAHPIIQQGVRPILEEIFFDGLSFEVRRLLESDRREEQ